MVEGLIVNSLLLESVYIHHSYRGYGIFHRNSSHASGCIVCLNKPNLFRCGATNVEIILCKWRSVAPFCASASTLRERQREYGTLGVLETSVASVTTHLGVHLDDT